MQKVFVVIAILAFPSLALADASMQLVVGQAKPVIASETISTIFIANPEIADYQVVDRTKVIVFGKKTGTTSIMVFDEKLNLLVDNKITVSANFYDIQQQIKLIYPDAIVDIRNIGEQILLTGKVFNEMDKDGINDLVGELLLKDVNTTEMKWDSEGEDDVVEFMTTRKYKGIANQIEVDVTRQVNVKLTIAEVSQSFSEQFGLKYNTIGQAAGTFAGGLNNFSANDLLVTINAAGSDSAGQILAEPNLSVISGESASFLAGGEVPIITSSNTGTSVSYKEFGVRLNVMVKVLRNNKIKLILEPEVSSLDVQYANPNYNLPSFKTRRTKTTIELSDGQSFVLGGLLNSEDIETLSKVPLIGDIPILGALFRDSKTTRSKTELVIVATVNIVNPIEQNVIQLPSMIRSTTLSRFFGIPDKEYSPMIIKKVDEILATGGFKK